MESPSIRLLLLRGYDMKTKEIKVLMAEPGKRPKVVMPKVDPDSLQKAVSIGTDYQGLIEIMKGQFCVFLELAKKRGEVGNCTSVGP